MEKKRNLIQKMATLYLSAINFCCFFDDACESAITSSFVFSVYTGFAGILHKIPPDFEVDDDVLFFFSFFLFWGGVQ